jgi:S1-C subfamily serine protease
MNRILILLASLLWMGESFALPPCPTSGDRDNCFGTYTYASGDKYVGEWQDGKQHGQGTRTWTSGDKYVGEFKDNQFDGQGTFTWVDGGKYVGEWKDGIPHGHGTFTFINGDKYVGKYKDFRKHGHGTMTYADGREYIGVWKDNQKHGRGMMTGADGEMYIGEWKNDKRHGHGASGFTWSGGGKSIGGDKYVGEWQDGKQHGQGTRTWADGSKFVGKYKNGYEWEGVQYSVSGREKGTYSNGEWCGGCKPTANQLAIVREINPGQIATTPTPQYGTLAIRGAEWSVGADVCVNKKYRGLSPIDLILIPGTYSVRIEKDSKLSVERQITLEAEKTKYWYVGLRPGVRINKCSASTPQPQPTPTPEPTPTYRLIGTGTGFAVNKKYVVTAEHVLEECNAVSIAHAHEEISAQTVARDKNNDLGLLKIEKPMANTAKLRDSPDLRVGDTAINYGYPLFGELSDSAKLNAGYVNSLAGYDNNSGVIQYSAPTQPGNSGGPVLDQSGNVIGVVSSGLSKRYAEESGHIAQNVNFAIKSTILEGFLKANKVPFEKADSTEKLELPDIAEKAETFTVLVGCWE